MSGLSQYFLWYSIVAKCGRLHKYNVDPDFNQTAAAHSDSLIIHNIVLVTFVCTLIWVLIN